MRRAAGTCVVACILFLVYVSVLRPWHAHWGATRAEIAGALPGDSLVQRPLEVTTRAITIHARPHHIWPWLAQMGKGRGGLYSYDGLDRLFGVLDAPSADTLLPAFQQLAPGDSIPVGNSTAWPVAVAIPDSALLLDVRQAGAHITWVFVIDSVSATESRLVTRVRARLPMNWQLPLLMTVLDPAEFLMVRRQLLGIRQRAERLAAADTAYHRGQAGPQRH